MVRIIVETRIHVEKNQELSYRDVVILTRKLLSRIQMLGIPSLTVKTSTVNLTISSMVVKR